MKKIFVFLAIVAYSLRFAFAQSVVLDNWNFYSSLLNITDGVFAPDSKLWIATNGGIFYYNTKTKEFNSFNNINGIFENDIKIIAFNKFTNEIYAGSSNGVICIFKDNRWENILDIYTSSFQQKAIQDFLFTPSIVYICGDFGFTTFDPTRKVFLKTPSRLGNFPTGTKCYSSVIFQNKLWVATENGIASITTESNINDPNQWSNYVLNTQPSFGQIISLKVQNEILYAFAPNRIYVWQNDSFAVYKELAPNNSIISVKEQNGKIYYSTRHQIFDLTDNEIYNWEINTKKAEIRGFAISQEETIAIFLQKQGILLLNPKNGTYSLFKPNTPFSNQFNYLAIDKFGGLWSATDADPRGEGLIYFKDFQWINFNTDEFPEIPSNNFVKVSTYANKIYGSNWGKGLLEITIDGENYLFKTFNNLNSPLTGIVNDLNYVLVQQTAYESSKSLLWILNQSNGAPGYLLLAKDSYDAFHPFIFTTKRNFDILTIDLNGTKWIASSEASEIIFFNERALNDSTDDVFGFLNQLVSIPASKVNCLVMDAFGYLWAGTSQGMFIIINPQAVLLGSTPVVRKLKTLADQIVNWIYVDPLNLKWIATNNGIFVLSEDGSEIIQQFNTQNSPLKTNEIRSITSNPTTGSFYFGTKIGLYSASSFNVKPSENYKISVSPQPFVIPDDEYIVIDGLAQDSEIKILTINGEIVRTLTTNSKKIKWDGRDYNNQPVASGVYIIVAKSITTKETGIAKFSVIRKN